MWKRLNHRMARLNIRRKTALSADRVMIDELNVNVLSKIEFPS